MTRPARCFLSLMFAALLCMALPAARAADTSRHSAVSVPAAPGSQSPRLSVGEDGAVVLSWLEPDGAAWALRYSRWHDNAFQPPATVARGENWFVNWADLPAVTPIRDDFWVAHWLERRPAGGYAYDIRVAVSNDAGSSWTDSQLAHRDGTDSEHGFVSLYSGAEGAGLVWLDGRRTADAGGMTLRAATLTPGGQFADRQELDGLVCDCCQTAAAVTPAGPVAVYRDRTDAEVRDIYAAFQVDGEWQPGVPVASDGWVIDGCPVNGPVVQRIDTEVVVAWFTAADGRRRVRLARSAASESSFSVPIDVFDVDTLGHVGLALLDDGAAVVSALRPGSKNGAALVLARVSRDGEVGAAVTLADDLPSFSVPQLVRSSDGLLAVWTTIGDDGDRSLRAALLPVDSLD